MVNIYCLEDINDLKYVGSTKQTLERRKQAHNEKRKDCSSSLLHVEHSIIYLLEECEDKDRKEREAYWINKLDCVNTNKLDSHKKVYESRTLWHKNNRERINQKQRERRQKNIDKVRKSNNEYYHKNKDEINRKRREKYLSGKSRNL